MAESLNTNPPVRKVIVHLAGPAGSVTVFVPQGAGDAVGLPLDVIDSETVLVVRVLQPVVIEVAGFPLNQVLWWETDQIAAQG